MLVTDGLSNGPPNGPDGPSDSPDCPDGPPNGPDGGAGDRRVDQPRDNVTTYICKLGPIQFQLFLHAGNNWRVKYVVFLKKKVYLLLKVPKKVL